MASEVVQLRINLKYSKPPIWRRVMVRSEISFYELHYTIQMAMGWGAYHLYEFEVEKFRIGIIDEDTENYGFSDLIDSRSISLEEVLAQGCKKIKYLYDFGDNWEHEVLVEKVLPVDPDTFYPLCTAGKRNCPPEDCGGMPGYQHFLEVMKTRKGPEYREMKHWAGGDFDPEDFDLEETNMYLEDIQEFMEDQDEDEDLF